MLSTIQAGAYRSVIVYQLHPAADLPTGYPGLPATIGDVSAHCPICGRPMPNDPFCTHCGFPFNLPDGQSPMKRRLRVPIRTSDYVLGWGVVVVLAFLILCLLIR